MDGRGDFAQFGNSFGVFSARNRDRHRSISECWSELLSGRFLLQQDRNAVADGIDALALIALECVFAMNDQRFAADRTGKDLEQVGRNHPMILVQRGDIGAWLLAISFLLKAFGAAPDVIRYAWDQLRLRLPVHNFFRPQTNELTGCSPMLAINHGGTRYTEY